MFLTFATQRPILIQPRPTEGVGEDMATIAPEAQVLRRSEAARVLGVHPNTVMSWALRGWLESIEFPSGEKRYTVESVEALRERIYGKDET